jgi:hypothetical protein
VDAVAKPETLAQALKRLNDMEVPPHAPMPIVDELAYRQAAAPVEPEPSPRPTRAAGPTPLREARPARRL